MIGTPIIRITMFIQTVNEKPLETSVMSPNFEMTAPTISKAVRMMNALIRSLLTFTFSEAYGIGIKQSNTGRYYCGGENYAVYIHKPRDAESLYYIEIRNLSLSHAGHAVKHGKYDHAEHDNIQ